MKQSNKLLAAAAEKLDLPGDIVAGQPRIELIGDRRCSIEPHRGLLEYSKELVMVESSAGKVKIAGTELNIIQMNREKITVAGTIFGVSLEDMFGE